MNLLVVATSYPHPGHPFGGIFVERTVNMMRRFCDRVAVLAPRPYAPAMLSSLAPRWRAYSRIPARETRSGVLVARPAYPQLPRVGGVFCFDTGAYLLSRRLVAAMHERIRFDAVLCFDLSAGGLGRRIASALGIAACGWACGSDVRVPGGSSRGRALIRTLDGLDLVFYQSSELLERAAELLQVPVADMRAERHVVLPRGIPEPPPLAHAEFRTRVRRELRIAETEILLLSTGRISREKGAYELLTAVSKAVDHDPRIKCVLLGSMPAFDETRTVEAFLARHEGLRNRVVILPACDPDRVWDYLCAADLFVFPSHHEGMPNSLLEAMAIGLPAIAFAIPPVREIEGGSGALVAVPAFDVASLSQAIVRLAESPDERRSLGDRGRARVAAAYMLEKNAGLAVKEIERVVRRRTEDFEAPSLTTGPGERA